MPANLSLIQLLKYIELFGEVASSRAVEQTRLRSMKVQLTKRFPVSGTEMRLHSDVGQKG